MTNLKNSRYWLKIKCIYGWVWELGQLSSDWWSIYGTTLWSINVRRCGLALILASFYISYTCFLGLPGMPFNLGLSLCNALRIWSLVHFQNVQLLCYQLLGETSPPISSLEVSNIELRVALLLLSMAEELLLMWLLPNLRG